ncbi:hypothetical protein [Leeuwenhoekiella marinoflava]|nr:hypothetical protein [Leeuwenhoekiella marinoflava]
MSIQNPQDLIGKHISILPNYEQREYSEANQKLEVKNFYAKTDLSFLDEDINSLLIKTDKNDLITEVSFAIYQILDNPNYLYIFNKEFDKPEVCFSFGELKESSEHHSAEGVVTESKIFSKEKCDCNADDVVYSVWKLKDNLYLQVTHPFTEYATFPRLGVKFSQTNDLLEVE